MISLTGRAKENLYGGYMVCPNLGDGDIGSVKIATVSPFEPVDVKTLIGRPFWESVPPFEKVATMSLNDFYKLMISDQQSACFNVK